MDEHSPVVIPDDLEYIPNVAKILGRTYSAVYNKAHKGKVAVHFVVGDTQAKISLSETIEAFKNDKPQFSAPSFRIIRHDIETPAAPQKADLFA